MARVFILAQDKLLVTVYSQQKKLWEAILELLEVNDLDAHEFIGYYYDDWKSHYGEHKISKPIKNYAQLSRAIAKSDNLLLTDEVTYERFTIYTRYTNEKDGY